MSTQLNPNHNQVPSIPLPSDTLQTVHETLDRYAVVWALTQAFIETNNEIILLLDNNLNIIKASQAAIQWLSPNNGFRESKDIEGRPIIDFDKSKRRRVVYRRVANGHTYAVAPAKNFNIIVQKIPGGIAITGASQNK